MQKPIYAVWACALAAVAIFVWSQHSSVFSRMDTASASLLPRSSSLAAIPKKPTTAPIEMMTTYDKPLPAEQWDAL